MTKELKKKTVDDLMKDLREKREGLRAFRFAIQGSKARNVKEGKALRKEIAQTLTELNTRK